MSLKRNIQIAIVAMIAILFLITDRFLKSLAWAGAFDEPVFLWGDLFSFKFAKNYFIAFSLPVAGGVILKGFIGAVILGLICYLVFLFKKRRSVWEIFFLLLLILGASSNLADRLKLGFVVDYWHLKYFTVFNLADTMITVGAVGLIILGLIRSSHHKNFL